MSDLTLTDIQRKAIRDFCKEMSASMTRVEGEKTFQSEAVTAIAKEHSLEKGLLKSIANTFHRSKFQETRDKNDEFENVYMDVFAEEFENAADTSTD